MTVFRKLSLRQPGVSHEILAALEPQIFNAETEEHDEEELMYLVCRLLKVRKDTRLPSITHSVPHEVPALIAALSQHYQAKGGLPAHLKSLQALLKGYFAPLEDGKSLVCTEDTKEKKTELRFEYADELEIVNCLDVNTDVRVTTKGRTAIVDSVAQEFSDEGVEMPQLLADWKGALFGEKLPETTPQKRKAEHSPSPPAAASSAFASKSSVLVGAALRRKVSQRNLDDGTPRTEQR